MHSHLTMESALERTFWMCRQWPGRRRNFQGSDIRFHSNGLVLRGVSLGCRLCFLKFFMNIFLYFFCWWCSSRLFPFPFSPGTVNPTYKVRDGEMRFGSERDHMLSDKISANLYEIKLMACFHSTSFSTIVWYQNCTILLDPETIFWKFLAKGNIL